MTAFDPLAGRTAFITGGSRGIGLEIARTLARAGANIALIAKTDTPDPRLPGTIHDAADELRGLGADVLPFVGDIRDEERVSDAVTQTAERFGGIDLCINNASALNLSDIATLPVKRFDLLQSVNVRGTFVVTQACLPHLRKSDHAHVLTLSPPLNLDPVWFATSAYTVSKYGMTIVTLGVARTEREHAVAANCLWPLTAIATAAVQNLLGGEDMVARSRTPQIVADAAGIIVCRDPAAYTGNTAIVEDVLAEEGINDLIPYNARPSQTEYAPDFFIDPARLHAGSPQAPEVLTETS
jgi:NAD(P)-dependent dehydrogenase (short-subunit alcohol dehydrogenase family)